MVKVKRGDIWLAALDPTVGTEIDKARLDKRMGKVDAAALSALLGVLRDTFEELSCVKVGAGGTAGGGHQEPFDGKLYRAAKTDCCLLTTAYPVAAVLRLLE